LTGLMDKVIVKVNQNELDWLKNDMRIFFNTTWPHQGAILENKVPFQICNVPFQISNGPQLWLVKLCASLCIKRIAGIVDRMDTYLPTSHLQSMKTPLKLNTWLVWWIKSLSRLIKMNLID
jgi:hypothetical protein